MPSPSEAPVSPSAAPTSTVSPGPTATPSALPTDTQAPATSGQFHLIVAHTCARELVPAASYPSAIAAPPPSSLILHVPILEYHRIVPPAQAGNSIDGLVVPPEIFDAQLTALQAAGWHTITLAALADDLYSGVKPPPKSFVITIDDGWSDGYTYAFPILNRHGFVATFFVIAGRIGMSSFLGPTDLQTMVAAGNEIGSHTVTHAELTAIQPGDLAYEIDSAAATIAAVTGRWPVTLAYPRGKEDPLVVAAVAACASMRLAVAEGNGGTETWANRFRIARLQVGPARTPADLLAQMAHLGG